MKRTWLFIPAAALAATLALPALQAQNTTQNSNGPNVLDYIVSPNSVVFGRTFSEWDSEWQQWVYSIPVASHPLFDNTQDCSTGQSGPVWFLGGKFCSNVDPQCGSYVVARSCTVPRGKYLYFPIDNAEDSTIEESVAEHPGDAHYQLIGTMREGWDPWVSKPTTEYAIIDGVRVPHLQNYAVQSTVFGFTIPDDNLLKAIYAPPNNDFQAGYYAPAVDDGRYLMLAPLPPGIHTIRFGASWSGWGFDVTYNIVVPK